MTALSTFQFRSLRTARLVRVTAAPDTLDDAALVALVARGDERALGELHDRHVRLALSIANRLVRDAGAAHEVVQDAFLDLWRTAPTFDPERASVTTWLVRLVRLRAIDRLRRDGAERRGAGRSDAELDAAAMVADDVDVARLVEDEQTATRVRAALDELSPDQRRIVELAFLAGHTHAELAELLDLPLGTIKTRCFRGLARLAHLLADEREGATR